MGIDYSATIIYGLPSEEVPELLEDFEGDYLYYEKGLSRASPYYDSDSDAWIIGVEIASSGYYQVEDLDMVELIKSIEEAKEKFFTMTGKVGKLYLSPHAS